ncbi:uncharacterized protein LOC126054524 [Helicoverpa armigera]|uniref:uncharacterized protein LOC126054524 n=1 Tax=Helicoverpa armigera TaxID=29058 RepID=UPI0030834794
MEQMQMMQNMHHDAALDKETCINYGYSEINCCTNELPANQIDNPYDMSDCSRKSLCEEEFCRNKKLGLIGDDDKLDRSKALDAMFKKVLADPSLLEVVQSKCINGDIKPYGSAESCEGERFNRCVVTQWLKSCTKWNDSSTCQQTKEFFIKEC